MKPVARCWGARFFPHPHVYDLTAEEARDQLRLWFEQWGLPLAIRVDNGVPWATQSDIPSALALWLVGLGIEVMVNRPRHSTDNGIVERDHGVLARWVEPHHAADLTQFQRQLDWAITLQREQYPALNGQSRLATYPDLQRNRRTYLSAHEPQRWCFARVEAWLATAVWSRKVDKVGRISLFSTAYSVGRTYHGQTVTIHFDPSTHEWVIQDTQGQALRRYTCREITPQRILNLALAKRANLVSPLSA